MASEFHDVSWIGLAWASLLVLITLVLSRWQGLGLEKRLLIGCVRTVAQLLLIGFVLGWIIAQAPLWVVLLAVAAQIGIASWSTASLQQAPLPGVRWIALKSFLPSYLLVMAVLIALVIQPDPWWNPRILLPLGGMLLGNALTGVALAINRYRGDLKINRDLILARLALGVTWRQAVHAERNAAAYAALLPSVSALLTVGLVALPGMMTGQIIAGADPLIAVRYQIVVMFMITAMVALAVPLALEQLVRSEHFEA